MIRGINVSKSFDNIKVLDNVNFNIPDGSVYGIIGSNGAGKSTLLRHISGIFKVDSGKILMDDEEIFENISSKSSIAFISDDIFYYHNSTIEDMKKMYKGIYSSFDEDVYEQMFYYFSQINPKTKFRNMSKGMQKQAAFMLAMSICPKYLILDEPVDGLAPVVRKQVWKIVLSKVSEKIRQYL